MSDFKELIKFFSEKTFFSEEVKNKILSLISSELTRILYQNLPFNNRGVDTLMKAVVCKYQGVSYAGILEPILVRGVMNSEQGIFVCNLEKTIDDFYLKSLQTRLSDTIKEIDIAWSDAGIATLSYDTETEALTFSLL